MILLPGYSIILSALFFSLVFALIDWKVLQSRVILDHKPRVLIRGVFFTAFSVVQHLFIPTPWIYLLIPLGVLLQASIFWILFDISLNLFRKLGVFYVGSVADLDETFEPKPFMQYVAKGSLLLVASASYFSIVDFF